MTPGEVAFADQLRAADARVAEANRRAERCRVEMELWRRMFRAAIGVGDQQRTGRP